MRSSCSTGCGARTWARSSTSSSVGLDACSRTARSSSQLDAKGRQWLADKGYDPAYGARPLKRVIQKWVQDPLAQHAAVRRDPRRLDRQDQRRPGEADDQRQAGRSGEETDAPTDEADDRARFRNRDSVALGESGDERSASDITRGLDRRRFVRGSSVHDQQRLVARFRRRIADGRPLAADRHFVRCRVSFSKPSASIRSACSTRSSGRCGTSSNTGSRTYSKSAAFS